MHVCQYKGYFINRYRFRIESEDINKMKQNSGVMQTATTECYSNSRDQNPSRAKVDYYGILTNVMQIFFTEMLTQLLCYLSTNGRVNLWIKK